MPRLDKATGTSSVVVSRPVNHSMQSLDFIMFTGKRFPDSCNGTSNPVQQLTVNALADLGPHQQPRIATSEYFTWETGHTTCARHKLSSIENSTTIVVIRPDNTRPVKNELSVIGNSTKRVAIRSDIQHQWRINYQS